MPLPETTLRDALSMSSARTCAAVRCGAVCITAKAAPETSGAAYDVPPSGVADGPGETPSPGAVMGTSSPSFASACTLGKPGAGPGGSPGPLDDIISTWVEKPAAARPSGSA